MKPQASIRLLVAASGTGGHLYPALALADFLTATPSSQLTIPESNYQYHIEWLGVPDRMETRLVPSNYPLHTINVEGFQKGLGLGTWKIISQFFIGTWVVRRLLKKGNFDLVFTTGGYIAAPAILAARLLGIPVILHESNALPGKVTRWLSPWCTWVALGFQSAVHYLPRSRNIVVGTPTRSKFHDKSNDIAPSTHLVINDNSIPRNVPLIVVVGGSQGALAINQLVRECAPQWLELGVWIIHLTGEKDPDVSNLHHPHYISQPFFEDMAALFQQATLVISRAGAGSLTELAIMGTPAILIPYPFAADDHQTKNAQVFAEAGAAIFFQHSQLTPEVLTTEVIQLLNSPALLQQLRRKMYSLAVTDSVERLAQLLGESAPLPTN